MEKGIVFERDQHNRVTREIYPDTPDTTERTIVYGTTTVTTTDQEGRVTVATRVPFGHPEDAHLVQLVDGAQQTWNYAYNVRGDLTSVTGPGGVQRTWTYDPLTLLLASETHPESGTTLYEVYDAGGVLKQRRDANGTVFAYGHDTRKRLTSVTATPVCGPVQVSTIAYEPGSNNRQTTTVDGVMTVLGYDGAGRVASRTDVVDGKSFGTFYGWDARDRLDTITYPNGREVGHDYDSEGRLARVFNPATNQDYASVFQYHPSGAVSAYTAGNGLVTTLTYDADRQWLKTIGVGPLALTYHYDGVGNVEQMVDPRPGMTQTFTYDDVDRLLTATSSGGYPAQTFAYDAHGNRQTAGGTSYAYYTGNPFRLWKVNGAFDLGYDANGNLTSGTFGSYAFTPDNLMRRSVVGGLTVDFAYDIDAWRVKKATTGGATVYAIRGPNGQLLTEWTNTSPTASVRDYVYAGGRLIAVVTTNAAPK